jgi:hypothetical protein
MLSVAQLSAGAATGVAVDAVAVDALRRETDTSVAATIDLRRFMNPLLQCC